MIVLFEKILYDAEKNNSIIGEKRDIEEGYLIRTPIDRKSSLFVSDKNYQRNSDE